MTCVHVHLQDSLKVLRVTYKSRLWDSLIPVDTLLREASSAGITPAMFDPQSRVVSAYTNLLEYLLHSKEQLVTGTAV